MVDAHVVLVTKYFTSCLWLLLPPFWLEVRNLLIPHSWGPKQTPPRIPPKMKPPLGAEGPLGFGSMGISLVGRGTEQLGPEPRSVRG